MEIFARSAKILVHEHNNMLANDYHRICTSRYQSNLLHSILILTKQIRITNKAHLVLEIDFVSILKDTERCLFSLFAEQKHIRLWFLQFFQNILDKDNTS